MKVVGRVVVWVSHVAIVHLIINVHKDTLQRKKDSLIFFLGIINTIFFFLTRSTSPRLKYITNTISYGSYFILENTRVLRVVPEKYV